MVVIEVTTWYRGPTFTVPVQYVLVVTGEKVNITGRGTLVVRKSKVTLLFFEEGVIFQSHGTQVHTSSGRLNLKPCSVDLES